MRTVIKFRGRRILMSIVLAAVVVAGVGVVMAQRGPGAGEGRGNGPPRGDRPGLRDLRPPRPQAVQLNGTVESFNLNGHGGIDGMMVKINDRTVQINLPTDVGVLVSERVAAGAQVQFSGFPEPGEADHDVYEIKSLTTSDGKELKLAGPDDDRFAHVEGTVKRLNYARQGEVNGAVLDNGDLILLGPAAAHLKLEVGQKVTVDGFAHPMLNTEHAVVQAVALDGKAVHRTPPPPGGRGAGPGGREGGPGDGRGRGAGFGAGSENGPPGADQPHTRREGPEGGGGQPAQGPEEQARPLPPDPPH